MIDALRKSTLDRMHPMAVLVLPLGEEEEENDDDEDDSDEDDEDDDDDEERYDFR